MYIREVRVLCRRDVTKFGDVGKVERRLGEGKYRTPACEGRHAQSYRRVVVERAVQLIERTNVRSEARKWK